MTLYRVTAERFESVPRTTYAAENLFERKDIQRLLRKDLTPIGDDLMVIAEEFGDWEESNRRIDLLCLSRDASLVVVEIKRTDDGGHMELQAVRYAAMVARMTLEQTVAAYAQSHDTELETAKNDVTAFLQEVDAELSGEVRIVLVSADFSTELTTAVLWLNQHDLDIRCVRLRPHRLGNEILVDATQIIPLPETRDYEVKLREQEKEKRKVMGVRQETLRKFWAQLIERSRSRTQLLADRSTTSDHWITLGIGRSGFGLNITLTQHEMMVDCYIRVPGGEAKNLEIFNALLAQRVAIEANFGGPLEWQELPGRQGCRICISHPGGWKSSEAEWPELQERTIDSLTRLEASLKRPIVEMRV